jgi:hypothetical protein
MGYLLSPSGERIDYNGLLISARYTTRIVCPNRLGIVKMGLS